MAVYKEGAESGMTDEQREKWEKLHEMGWKDVAKVWREWCNDQNYSDSYRQRFVDR